MTRGRGGLIALIGLVATVAAIGIVIMLPSLVDPCMNGGAGASCPALADVAGNRYTVGLARDFVASDQDLEPFAPIAKTNAPEMFAELTALKIPGVDPLAALAAPAGGTSQEGRFLLLFGPNKSEAWPALCDYFPVGLRSTTYSEHCAAPA